MSSNNQQATSVAQDAIVQLTSDHRKVKQLFAEYAKVKQSASDEEKSALVERICNELKVHTDVEEKIFYPEVRKAAHDDAMVDEALVEHAGAKELIAQLEEMDPEDDLYDAKVTVLGEQVEHHVKEEEREMFPQAKKADVDTVALGAKIAKRKAALMQELGMSSEGDEGHGKSPGRQKTGTK